MDPGFTIGHEFVGTGIAAGEGVARVGVGENVIGHVDRREALKTMLMGPSGLS